ncbi:unnamed protein product [Aphanomyces euteiches]
MKRGNVPSIFRQAPSGVESFATAAGAIPGSHAIGENGAVVVPARFWVRHDQYQSIKRASGTDDSPGIRKQNAARVLHELRQARSVVENQLQDFQRHLREVEEWMVTLKNDETADVPQQKRRRKHKRPLPFDETMMSPILSDGEADLPSSTLPTFDLDTMDLDLPCTTTECWQFVRAARFFDVLTEDEIQTALAPIDELESEDVETPPPPAALAEKLLAALIDLKSSKPDNTELATMSSKSTSHAIVDENVETLEKEYLKNELAVLALWETSDMQDATVDSIKGDPSLSLDVHIQSLVDEFDRVRQTTNAALSTLRTKVLRNMQRVESSQDTITIKQYRKLAKQKQQARRRRRHLEKKALKHR